MANATVMRPADGAENSAAPHTELTSMNVPMNSAPNFWDIVPASPLMRSRFRFRSKSAALPKSTLLPENTRVAGRVQRIYNRALSAPEVQATLRHGQMIALA